MKDKVVIITGAARGLGQKYAIEFAKIGAKIVFADINSCSDTENKIEKLTDNFLNIKEILEQSNAGIENAEITMLPSNSVKLGDEDSEKVIRLIDTLEDLDDVQNVYTNAELSEASVT